MDINNITDVTVRTLYRDLEVLQETKETWMDMQVEIINLQGEIGQASFDKMINLARRGLKVTIYDINKVIRTIKAWQDICHEGHSNTKVCTKCGYDPMHELKEIK